MLKIECYSLLVNGPINKPLSDQEREAIFKNCTYEYGVEVTPETFEAINEFKLHNIVWGYNLTKYYYFKKVFTGGDEE